MDRENFGRFIAEARRNAGLTQKDLADKLHVTNSAVSKWERGLCYPDITQMESLAQTLGLTLTELLSCGTITDAIAASPQAEENVSSLLDIAKESSRYQRIKIFGCMIAAFVAVLLAALALYFCVAPSIDQVVTLKYFGCQTKNGQNIVYMEWGDTLLCLRCEDPALFDSIASSYTGQYYEITYRLDRWSNQAVLLLFEENREILGTELDTQGCTIGMDDLFGIPCVWNSCFAVYRAPSGDGLLYSYRLYYQGDGERYFTDDKEENELLTIRDCRGIAASDYDDDGIVELFVWTKYDDAPYIRYDVMDGEIFPTLVDEVPADVLRRLQMGNPVFSDTNIR